MEIRFISKDGERIVNGTEKEIMLSGKSIITISGNEAKSISLIGEYEAEEIAKEVFNSIVTTIDKDNEEGKKSIIIDMREKE